MTALTLEHIEAKRAELGVSKQALEREAGLPTGYYSGYLLAGRVRPRVSTLAKLLRALRTLTWRADLKERHADLNALYRVMIAATAYTFGVKPGDVHRQDPARRATQSADWMQAAEVRRVTLYLLNTALGYQQSKVARAAGMTKQAVSLACREIEERRDDPDFNRLLDRLTTDIQGDW